MDRISCAVYEDCALCRGSGFQICFGRPDPRVPCAPRVLRSPPDRATALLALRWRGVSPEEEPIYLAEVDRLISDCMRAVFALGGVGEDAAWFESLAIWAREHLRGGEVPPVETLPEEILSATTWVRPRG